MDRNQTIGIVLITVLFGFYIYFFGNEEPTTGGQNNIKDSTVVVKNTTEAITNNNDSSNVVTIDSTEVSEALVKTYGVFAPGAQGKAEQIIIENNDVIFQFNSKGGFVEKVTLKNDYKTAFGAPLTLFDPSNDKQSLSLFTKNDQPINLRDLYYDVNKTSDTTIEFTLNLGNNKIVKQKYTIPQAGYKIGYNIQLQGLTNDIKATDAVFGWNTKLPKLEYDYDDNRDKSTISFYTVEGDYEKITEQSTSEEKEEFEQKVKWVSLKNKFFNHAIIAEDNSFNKGSIQAKPIVGDTSVVKDVSAEMTFGINNLVNGANFAYYYGPNHFYICRDVTEGFEENVNLGWPIIKVINRFVVVPAFKFFEGFFTNYGIIIVLLVILLRIILFPLSYKSFISMAKMKVMKPELDEIKAQFGEDMQRVQQEQMNLYRKVGINPLSGCIPMVLQMPILFAMFSFFPTAIELRQESFLWCLDLSIYDHPIMLPFAIPFYGSHVSIFTLLMTVSTLVYTYYNNQMSTQTGPMQYISYAMPVVFMFVLNKFAAGLSFYYFVSNVASIVQQLIIKRFVDETEIRRKLDENKVNFESGKVKKNKFMARLDEAVKAQEEMRKNKKNKK